MEIEVRDFIRTNKGIIGRIKRIEFDKTDTSLKWYVFDKRRPDMNVVDEIYINKPYIVKHSKNIIDLIEVGDVIQYKEQTEGKEGTVLNHVYAQQIHSEAEVNEIKREIKENGIKIIGILTKEQFEGNCYRLEE